MKRIQYIVRQKFILLLMLFLGPSFSLSAQDQTNPPLQTPTQPSTDGGFSIPSSLNPSNYADRVKSEIEGILGELEDTLMQGISDLVSSLITAAIQQLLDVSPLRSVEKLRKLMKDAYSKQQKIDYQAYKVDFAEQKANTELSTNLSEYYKALKLNEKGGALQDLIQDIDQAVVRSGVFSDRERSDLRSIVTEIGDLSYISNEIKVAVNQGSETAYMEEADRIRILDDSEKLILQRFKHAQILAQQISFVINYRSRDMNRQQLYSDIVGQDGDKSAPRVKLARPAFQK